MFLYKFVFVLNFFVIRQDDPLVSFLHNCNSFCCLVPKLQLLYYCSFSLFLAVFITDTNKTRLNLSERSVLIAEMVSLSVVSLKLFACKEVHLSVFFWICWCFTCLLFEKRDCSWHWELLHKLQPSNARLFFVSTQLIFKLSTFWLQYALSF